MENFHSKDRTMIKIADHTPTSILRNVYESENSNERSPSRIGTGSGVSRHRVGASPVRVKRSINDSVPTAVVQPTPPTKSKGDFDPAPTVKNNDAGPSISYTSGPLIRFSPAPTVGLPWNNSNPNTTGPWTAHIGASLSRRSRSSIGSAGLGLLARKLEYQDFDAGVQQQQQQRSQRVSWAGDHYLDAENQVPSNSILSLHSLLDDNRNASGVRDRDDSQERRLKELETRLREIEVRLVNSTASKAAGDSKLDTPKLINVAETVRSPKSSNSPSVKANGDFGSVSIAMPPMMALDGGVYRVQPAPRSEIKAQREIDRLEKKLKNQEEMAEAVRTQSYKQIEQLTRQLASHDDVTQTLRSRIRELELENELWQNRFRLYNDVDVAKILRENERLRARQRKRSVRDENGGNDDELRKREQIEEENKKLRSRYAELENKYHSAKEKYKESIRAYRNRRRQDHIELESLKVSMALQDTEVAELRKQIVDQPTPSTDEAIAATPVSTAAPDVEFITYNLDKCYSIADCLSTIATHIKQKQPLDPEVVLNSGPMASKGRQASKTTGQSLDDALEELATKMTTLHSMVIDLYGDDLADAVTCNVQ